MIEMILSDPMCYCINSISMGDVLAAAPVVKWAVEHFHKDGKYKVLTVPQFRGIFHFIPDSNWGSQQEKHNFQLPWQIRYLNTPKSANARTSSMHMHLSDFASIQLLNRLIPREERHYLPLPRVDLGGFSLDFSRCVLLGVTYRDAPRKISFEVVKGVSEYLLGQGLTPVYIGKEDDDPIWGDAPFRRAFKKLPPGGVSLMNMTSIPELASIMGQSRGVVGIDSGPIHLAGTTGTAIVCGFTNVAPEHRFPLRAQGEFIPIVPDSPCKHCQSYWSLNYHDFGECYLKHLNCVGELTADKFIGGLKAVGI